MNVEALKKMRDAGLTLEQAIDILEAMQSPVKSAASERQRRYRERKRDVTRDVTRDASLPLDKENPPNPLKKLNPIPSKNPPKGGQKGSRRAPAEWFPRHWTLDALEAEGHLPGDIERALTRMRDHEFKTARSDWDATFRNWVRSDADRRPKPTSGDAKYEARQANLARAVSGFEQATRQRWEP